MTQPEYSPLSEKREYVPEDIEVDRLLALLMRAGVPVEQFGVGAAKTIYHLLKEVVEGESVLSIDQQGELHREVSVLWLDVIHEREDGAVFVLKEEKQVFKDGREKYRTLNSSIGEKLKPGEDPECAVPRALGEELGIEGEVMALYHIGNEETVYTPDTYPGLQTEYRFYKYAAVIPEEAFNPDGYIEYQSDKTNYYSWDQVNTSEP